MDKKDYIDYQNQNYKQDPSSFAQEEKVDQVDPIQSDPSQSPSQNKSAPKSLKKYLLIGAISFVAFLLILIILIISLQKKQIPEKTPTPSPEIINNNSKSEQNFNNEIVDQVGKFEQNLNQLEIQELEIAPPQIDWKIEFDK